jgi:AcrR family transcriptional regulator
MTAPPPSDENALRLQILRKAQEEFFTHGFSKVTTDELATALGISKKTLYQHFQSKEQLLREATYLMRDEMAASIKGIVADPSLDFVSKLRGVMLTIGTRISRIRRAYMEDIRRKMPELWKELEEFRRERLLVVMTKLIEEGARSGELRREIDPRIFMMMFFTVIQNMMIPEVLAQLPFTASDLFDSFTRVMLTGVLSDEAREAYLAGMPPKSDDRDRDSSA